MVARRCCCPSMYRLKVVGRQSARARLPDSQGFYALPRLPAGIFYTQGVKDSSGVVEFSGIAYTEAVSYKLRIMRV